MSVTYTIGREKRRRARKKIRSKKDEPSPCDAVTTEVDSQQVGDDRNWNGVSMNPDTEPPTAKLLRLKRKNDSHLLKSPLHLGLPLPHPDKSLPKHRLDDGAALKAAADDVITREILQPNPLDVTAGTQKPLGTCNVKDGEDQWKSRNHAISKPDAEGTVSAETVATFGSTNTPPGNRTLAIGFESTGGISTCDGSADRPIIIPSSPHSSPPATPPTIRSASPGLNITAENSLHNRLASSMNGPQCRICQEYFPNADSSTGEHHIWYVSTP